MLPCRVGCGNGCAVLAADVYFAVELFSKRAEKEFFMTLKLNKRSAVKTAMAVGGALMAMATTTGAYAQFTQNQPSPWSLGGSVGRSDASIPNSAGDTNDTSYKLFGGYQFSPTWGAELGYNHLGKDFSMNVPGGTAKGKLTNWYGAAVGTMPLGNGFSLLGKLGATRNQADFGGAGETTRTQPLFGVGAEYAFSSNMSARLEYEDFGKFSAGGFAGNNGEIKANAVSLGLKAKF